MADILIKGLALPKEGDTYGLHLSIFHDGKVYVEYDEKPMATAIELPEHGDLVDITPIKDKMSSIINRYDIDDWGGKLADLISNAPVIVEATE